MKLLCEIAALALTRLARYIDAEAPSLREGFSGLLPTDSSDDAICSLERSVYEMAEPVSERLQPLARLFRGSRLTRVAAELATAQLLYPDVNDVFKALHGADFLTVELASRIAAVVYSQGEADAVEMLSAYEELSAFFIPSPQSDGFFFRQPLRADERLLMFYSKSNRLDKEISSRSALYFPTSTIQPLYTGDCAEVVSALKMPRAVVQISGEDGSGKLLRLRHACAELGRCLIAFDLRYTAPTERELRLLRREALLYDAVLCFRHACAETLPDDASVRSFVSVSIEPAIEMGIPVAVTTDETVSLTPFTQRFTAHISLPQTDRNARYALWQGYAGEYSITMDYALTTAKLKLSPAQIAQAAQRMAAMNKRSPERTEVTAICSEVLPPPRQGNVRRVNVHYTLDDIKLPAEQKQQLKDICAHVWYRRKVYDEWNLESRYAYGTNVSALFVGQPGTGKTMAVHVLSNMLDIPLYQIDLSQVVDKYIGETEKRLEEIFSTAERTNTILFFDEADSLFGKRSQVNEAKDRYANTEVSYILQRIEQYDGVVILASNFKTNIDNAFMRRIRYVVEFSLPDEALRREIWQSCFPPETPTCGLDLVYMAKQFELPGGDIKNIALNAAFLAAAKDEPVSMVHLLTSLRGEYQKMGKSLLKQDLCEYAYL